MNRPLGQFGESDPEILDIASVFLLKRWTWRQKDGRRVDPFIPTPRDIAQTLNLLYGYSTMAHDSNSGSSRGGRLFVDWIDEGYGPAVNFGICYSRLPSQFR